MENAKRIRRPVTATWLVEARSKIKSDDRTQKAIAAECGTSGAYMTQLLAGKYDTSTFLDCISKLLGIPTVPIAVPTPSLQELVDLTADLDEDTIEQLKVIARSLIKLRK